MPERSSEKQVLRLRLTDAQAQLVLVETGEELEELAYPDPGGELAAQLPDLTESDVTWLALAQGKALAAQHAREQAEDEAAAAEKERKAEAKRNAEELARVREEAEKGRLLAEKAKEEGLSGAKKKPRKRRARKKAPPKESSEDA